MSLENIRGVIRKIDYTLTEDEIDDWCEACRYAIQTETYDFSSFSREVYSQSGKKRVIYSFPKLSVENMLSHYLKQQLDRAFHIKYASRSKIINLLFNTLVATKNMNDFVIVRADFKSFFDSVKSEYVYEKYILPSIIKREDKQLLERYVENFKYCYAGLCLSNGMTEIVCKDFDIVLKARLSEYGVFFYERYVDDMLIMFNNYISENRIKNIIRETIIEVFGSCPVRLSSSPGKFSYISRRNLVSSQNFNFLGYEFFILKTVNGRADEIINFEYGIAEKKRTKSHVVRYGSKAKQSIMNQLNELICNYPNKDRTIIAYFLSSILNHIGKNKDKCTIFKNDVKGSTVFSFLDLTFYAYSFFPNYGNTQKLLQIISYVRDEYDIFEESTRLQALINKYAFIFDKANINDVVNLFLFCRQAKIEIPYLQEECIVRKIKEKDDPILWATYLMYSQYNRKYSDEIRSYIEKTLLEKIKAIRVQKSVYEYREFWWILIFNKCPFITNALQNAIDNAITLLNVPTVSGCTHTLVDIFKNYLQNSPIQFFDWDIERNDFLRTLTFKTHEKSIFKNYKENAITVAWGSI